MTLPTFAGRLEYGSACGQVRIVLDAEQCNYAMSAPLDPDPRLIGAVVDTVLDPLGFDLVPEGDCSPELIGDVLRIPVWPVDSAEAAAELEDPA